MDLLALFHAVVLGIVEGLTEFLPVSSTGHLIIAGEAIGFTGERAETFEIFIQLGAILAVLWLYRTRFTGVAMHALRANERHFIFNLLIAFLPAAVIGLLVHKYIKLYLFSTLTVAWALVVGGVAILLIERWQSSRTARVQSADNMTHADAFKVGLAQVVSLFPGVSRAGATIMGGMVTGLSRTAATEFSFFLAIPTMFAAVLFDLYKSRELLHREDLALFGVGFVVSFLVAAIVIKTFLVYVSKHTFRPFAWYRIVAGATILGYLYLH
jgi:undecaprenyl-diphosphatase